VTKEKICSSATSNETGTQALDTIAIFARPRKTQEMATSSARMPIKHVVLTAVQTASKVKNLLFSKHFFHRKKFAKDSLATKETIFFLTKLQGRELHTMEVLRLFVMSVRSVCPM
jgi:hypothetical protein